MSIEELIGKNESLCPELKKCVHNVGSFVALRHPLCMSVPYTPESNALINAQFIFKKKEADKAKDAKDYGKYIALHEKPFRFQAFNEICSNLTDQEYWETLGWIWTDSENLFEIKNLDSLLRSNRSAQTKMMRREEIATLEELPDKLAIYRGYKLPDRKIAHSWTLAYTSAWWFANRYKQNGFIVRGEIDKKDVIALMLRRNEMEIIALPEKVKNVSPVVGAKANKIVRKAKTMAENVFALPKRHSIHGPHHWFKVEMNGLFVAGKTSANKLVVQLFACLHDCKRENEESDPYHGVRAAEFIENNKHEFSSLDKTQYSNLIEAVTYHNDGYTSDDPTIGACWDADRLDLIRVGIVPDPDLLSTAVAKESILQI